jgi:antitoxin PrlF
MIQSRITSKAQTTIPAPVRKALGLREGDLVTYRIEEGHVVMTRAESVTEPADDPFATFSEWNTAADRDGYADF